MRHTRPGVDVAGKRGDQVRSHTRVGPVRQLGRRPVGRYRVVSWPPIVCPACHHASVTRLSVTSFVYLPSRLLCISRHVFCVSPTVAPPRSVRPRIRLFHTLSLSLTFSLPLFFSPSLSLSPSLPLPLPLSLSLSPSVSASVSPTHTHTYVHTPIEGPGASDKVLERELKAFQLILADDQLLLLPQPLCIHTPATPPPAPRAHQLVRDSLWLLVVCARTQPHANAHAHTHTRTLADTHACTRESGRE